MGLENFTKNLTKIYNMNDNVKNIFLTENSGYENREQKLTRDWKLTKKQRNQLSGDGYFTMKSRRTVKHNGKVLISYPLWEKVVPKKVNEKLELVVESLKRKDGKPFILKDEIRLKEVEEILEEEKECKKTLLAYYEQNE